MNKSIYILIISHLIISSFSFAQTATLDTNTILIGEQINLTLTNQRQNTEIWPTYNKFIVDGIEIINASEIDTINNVISQRFTITAWDSGSYYIPPILFSKARKTEGLLLNVQTIILAEDAKLKDIKEPMKAPIGWSDIWPWILVFLALALIIFLLKKYVLNRKEKTKDITPEIITPSDIIAIKQLTELENSKIWQKGNIKGYHSELSQIIRRYTENRFNFIALEITTDEILEEIHYILSNEQLSNLRKILERADLAKFAKSKPNEKENIESMILAKEFVHSTKQKEGDD